MSEVEKIYYNMDKLTDNFVDLPESEEARKKFDADFEKMIPEDKRMAFSDLMTNATSAYEKQGFIYGFNYAVALLTSGKVVSANE